jgi:hypothetical protein
MSRVNEVFDPLQVAASKLKDVPHMADLCQKIERVMGFVGVREMCLVVEFTKRAAYEKARERYVAIYDDNAEPYMSFDEFCKTHLDHHEVKR